MKKTKNYKTISTVERVNLYLTCELLNKIEYLIKDSNKTYLELNFSNLTP